MEENTSLILLIPCFNPSQGWEDNFVKRVHMFMTSVTRDVKIILINDGSTTDIEGGVAKIKKELGKIFFYLSQTSNKGKGAALKAGAAIFESDKYMFTDIDFPYTMRSMKAIYDELSLNLGLVIGHRPDTYYDNVGKVRIRISKILRSLNKWVMGLPTEDTQCGLKGFDHQVRTLLLDCSTDRFLIDLELLLKSNENNVSIRPVDVELRSEIEFTKFNSSVLTKEIFNFLKLIFKYRLFRRFSKK